MEATGLVRAYRHPDPTAIEFVDVVMVNGPADRSHATSVDITGDRVSRIAPYDIATAGVRKFEATGKYLVAGTLSLAKPHAFEEFKRTWMRPIGIDARSDFVLFDVDPRLRDVSSDQIAGAVIDGDYWSRSDLAARLR